MAGSDLEEEFGDDIFDDDDEGEIGTVHGPENCPRTCSVCSGKHHWIDQGHDPDEPMEEWDEDDINGSRADVRRMDLHHPLPQGIKREAAHWACKHCPAWAEFQ